MGDKQTKYIQSLPVKHKVAIPNLLLISGDGRNVGKTTLGCRIVKDLSDKTSVIAIKVSPHFHLLTDSLVVLMDTDSMVITRETDRNATKDSSRYLNAGASEVFYVQCKDDSFGTLSEWIHETWSDDIPILCESGGLKNFITPGYSIHIKEGIGEQHYFEDSGQEIIFNNFRPENVYSSVKWQNKKWQK